MTVQLLSLIHIFKQQILHSQVNQLTSHAKKILALSDIEKIEPLLTKFYTPIEMRAKARH